MNRSIPPSGSRLFVAARRGLYPRSGLLVAGAGFAGFGGFCALMGPALVRDLNGFITAGFEALFAGSSPGEFAAKQFIEFFSLLVRFLLSIALPVAAAWLLPALIFQSRSGRTAVPIPENIRRGGAFWLAGALTVGIAFLVWIHGIGHLPPVTSESLNITSVGDFLARAGTALFHSGLILILGGLIQLSLYKAALFQQLSLTRDDAEKEQRLAEANPLVRGWIRSDRKPG